MRRIAILLLPITLLACAPRQAAVDPNVAVGVSNSGASVALGNGPLHIGVNTGGEWNIGFKL